MALETIQTPTVDTIENDYSRKTGSFLGSIKAGFKSGLNENVVFSLLPSIAEGQEMANNPFDQVDPDTYKPGHPFYIEDLPIDQGVSYKHLYEMSQARMEAAKYAAEWEQGGLLDKGAFIASTFGAALLDPVTYIPVPFLKGVTSFTKQALSVGAFNSALELPLYPIVKESWKQRGLGEYEYEDLVNQMGLAFVVGGGLTTVMRGGGYQLAKLRAARLNKLSPLSRYIETTKEQYPDYDYDNATRDLISNDVLTRDQLDFDSIRKHTFTQDSVEDFWVDTAGRRKFIKAESTERDVKITSQDDGSKIISGPTDSILKVLSTIVEKTDETNGKVIYDIRPNDTSAVRLNKDGIAAWIQTNIPAAQQKLDARTNADKPWYDLSKYINKKRQFRADLDALDNTLYDRNNTFEIVPDPELGIDIERNIGKFYKISKVPFDPAKKSEATVLAEKRARLKNWETRLEEAKAKNLQQFTFENKTYNINDKIPELPVRDFPYRELVTDLKTKMEIIDDAIYLDRVRRNVIDPENNERPKPPPMYDPEDPGFNPDKQRIQQMVIEDNKANVVLNQRQDLATSDQLLNSGDARLKWQETSKDAVETLGLEYIDSIGFKISNGVLVDDGVPTRPLSDADAAIRAHYLDEATEYKKSVEIAKGRKDTGKCLTRTNSNI